MQPTRTPGDAAPFPQHWPPSAVFGRAGYLTAVNGARQPAANVAAIPAIIPLSDSTLIVRRDARNMRTGRERSKNSRPALATT